MRVFFCPKWYDESPYLLFYIFCFVLSCKYLMHKLAFICYIIPLFIMVKINLSYPFLLMC